MKFYCMDVDESTLAPEWEPVVWWQTGVEFKVPKWTPEMVCVDLEVTPTTNGPPIPTHWNLRPEAAGSWEQSQAIATYEEQVDWIRSQCPAGTPLAGYSIPCEWAGGSITPAQVAHWKKIIPMLGFDPDVDSLGLQVYKVYATETVAASAAMAAAEAVFMKARCELAVAVAEALGMKWGMFCMTRQKPITAIGPDGKPSTPPIGRSLRRPEVLPVVAAVKQYGPDWLAVFHGNKTWCDCLCHPSAPIEPYVRAEMRRQWAAETFPAGTPRQWDRLDAVRRAARRNLIAWCDCVRDGIGGAA